MLEPERSCDYNRKIRGEGVRQENFFQMFSNIAQGAPQEYFFAMFLTLLRAYSFLEFSACLVFSPTTKTVRSSYAEKKEENIKNAKVFLDEFKGRDFTNLVFKARFDPFIKAWFL